MLFLRSTIALAPARLLAPAPTVVGHRPFSFSASQLAPPPPTRPHTDNELEIRNKLFDRLEADACDVEDSSGQQRRYFARGLRGRQDVRVSSS